MLVIPRLKQSFSAFLHCFKKNFRKKISCLMGSLERALSFNVFTTSVKLNYGHISSFPNKFKFDDSNVSKKLLIIDQQTIDCRLLSCHVRVSGGICISTIFRVNLKFKSRYCRLNFWCCACFEQGVPWHSSNYRV